MDCTVVAGVADGAVGVRNSNAPISFAVPTGRALPSKSISRNGLSESCATFIAALVACNLRLTVLKLVEARRKAGSADIVLLIGFPFG